MLKKAGIVVAAATAGLLAVSPLAFAGDYGGDNGDHGGDNGRHHAKKADCEQDNSSKNGDNVQRGVVNIDDTTVQAPIQACGNDVLSGTLGIFAKDLKNISNDN